MKECSVCKKQGNLTKQIPLEVINEKVVPAQDTSIDSIYKSNGRYYCGYCFHLSTKERRKLKHKSTYIKKINKFNKDGVEKIIRNSKNKDHCMVLLKEYMNYGNTTVIRWIRKLELWDLWNNLSENRIYKTGVENHKSLNQDEIDYWQEIANQSSSFKEMYDIHSTKTNGFKKRSQNVFYKYLDLSFVLSPEERIKKSKNDSKLKSKKKVESLDFIKEVLSYDLSKSPDYHNVTFICNNNHLQEKRYIRYLTQCTDCYSEQKIKEKEERKLKEEKKKLKKQEELLKQKETEEQQRIIEVKEFFENDSWKDYMNVTDWPVYSDIVKLRKNNKFEYGYEYNTISYYEYKSTGATPPIEPKENHKWCRYCREEKNNIEFGKGNNICKKCTKKYRTENYLELEKKKAKEKYHSNPTYRLQSVISTHVWSSLRGLNKIKDRSFKEYIGLTKQEFRDYIQSLMTDKMTWDNYGTYWVIQHIIPRAWGETEEDVYKLNYHKNLMPYEFSPNASLSDNIILSQLNDYHFTDKRMQYFLDKAWKEDRLYENIGYTPLQYMLDGVATDVKRVDMNFDSWQEWYMKKEIIIKNTKEILEEVFTDNHKNKLSKILTKL